MPTPYEGRRQRAGNETRGRGESYTGPVASPGSGARGVNHDGGYSTPDVDRDEVERRARSGRVIDNSVLR